MMELDEVLAQAVNPALALLPANMTSAKARVMLLAIGLQESRFQHRRQIKGPARGFWQFERGTRESRGGMWGVYLHPASSAHLADLCGACGVQTSPDAMYAAVERDDVLAAGIARLLLWTDPRPLPAIGDAQGAWDCYVRNWRPGRPHPQTWGKLYDRAAFAVMAQAGA